MQDSGPKSKRVEPLIKVRKIQLDHEASILNQIKQEKLHIVNELKHYQNLYMEGIEALNTERQSASHNKLEPLERSVDTAKAQWYRTLKLLQEIESKEQAQLHQVLSAERNLRSMEKLKERYDRQAQTHLKSLEQKTTDNAAIRAFKDRS